MWQTFQGALERKVKLNGKKKERIDKYVIEKAFREVILDQFGQIGLSSVNLEIENQKYVKVKCKNSIWKSEFRMRKPILIKEINEKMGSEVVVNIVIN